LYAAEAMNAGDSVHLILMNKAGHFDGINPNSKTWPTVIDSIRSLQYHRMLGPINGSED
jgi:hypothetical protein